MGGSVGKIGSGNPYVYAGNEPNMETDPSGRDCVDSIFGNGFSLLSALSAILGAVWWGVAYIESLAVEVTVGSPAAVLVAIAESALVLAGMYAAMHVIKYYGNNIGHDCVGHDIV